ncbi:AraC-like ligand-binding domain-containing protein [Streptomyces sp. NPDC001450]
MDVLIEHSADTWAQVITDSFVPLTLGSAPPEFRGSVRQNALRPGLTLTEVRTRGQSVVTRTPRLARSEPRDDYLFLLHLAGTGTLWQDGHEAALPIAGGALCDAARPYRLVFPTGARQLVLQIPREQLANQVGHLRRQCGRPVPAEHPAARVLAAYLSELANVSAGLEPGQRSELGRTAVDLLATALRATAGDEPTAPDGRQATLATMRTFVHDHLTDPHLTPGTLARQHGVSVRYATQLFADSGTSPAAYIRSARLRAAHRALTDPRYTPLTIASIAARSGFTDRTTFTRAFVREYGITPAQLRAGAMRPA